MHGARRIETMSEAEKRAYVLADNKLALNAGWDEEILAEELKGILSESPDLDISLTGFSIPEIDSRYPLWDQPNFMRDVDEGRFFLPDAEELERETLITSPVDAKPVQCLRVPGPSFLPLLAAVFTGGVFILSTFHLYWPALVSGIVERHPLTGGTRSGVRRAHGAESTQRASVGFAYRDRR